MYQFKSLWGGLIWNIYPKGITVNVTLHVQSNLDYFGQGEISNRSDKQKVRITLTTPTRSIMHVKTYH